MKAERLTLKQAGDTKPFLSREVSLFDATYKHTGKLFLSDEGFLKTVIPLAIEDSRHSAVQVKIQPIYDYSKKKGVEESYGSLKSYFKNDDVTEDKSLL